MTVLSGLLGAGVAAGLLLIAHGLTPRPDPAPARRWHLSRPDAVRLALSLLAAALVGVATRWPVGAALAGAAALLAPKLVGGDRQHRRLVARSDAVASFTESLRDALGAAAGLEQAILGAATTAPRPIRPEVSALATDLRGGTRLGDALDRFRAAVDDPVADLVVAALHQAAQRQASRLADLLTTLSDVARRATTVRLRIAAARARVRTSARVVTVTTAALAVILVVANRAYLAPYDTLTGQIVLLAVGGLFAAGFAGLNRLGRGQEHATPQATS